MFVCLDQTALPGACQQDTRRRKIISTLMGLYTSLLLTWATRWYLCTYALYVHLQNFQTAGHQCMSQLVFGQSIRFEYEYRCPTTDSLCLQSIYLRCTLMCILLLAKHCYFVLEQPSNTLLQRHRRWEDFCNRTAYVSC